MNDLRPQARGIWKRERPVFSSLKKLKGQNSRWQEGILLRAILHGAGLECQKTPSIVVISLPEGAGRSFPSFNTGVGAGLHCE